MAAITIAPRLENPASDVESVVTGGYVQIRISAAVSSGGQWLLPLWSDPIIFTGSPVVVQLDPQAVVPYEARFHLPNGDEWLDFTEFRKVVDATARAWDTLEQVGAPGSAGAIPSDIAARLTALEATVLSISGGASTLAAITNMSPYMRTLNTETSATAARTNLNAPAIGDAPTAHTHAVPSGLVATGTASSSTFLRGDGAWASPPAAGSPAWTDITGKPTTFAPSAHSHPTSDVTGFDTAVSTAVTAASATFVQSAVLDTVIFSATAPTGAATDGVLVLTPVNP